MFATEDANPAPLSAYVSSNVPESTDWAVVFFASALRPAKTAIPVSVRPAMATADARVTLAGVTRREVPTVWVDMLERLREAAGGFTDRRGSLERSRCRGSGHR